MYIKNLTLKIFQKMSNLKPQSKRISAMAQKIDVMNQTLNKTSPKLFSLFMILSTLPSFYFGYKVITLDYNDPNFTVASNAGLSYINIKNIIFFACIGTLNKFRFNSPTSKHTLPRIGLFGSLIPPLISLVCLCLPSSDSKYIVFPTFLGDISMLILQTQAANYGIYPFWLYSYRHYIRFFDWIIIGCTFFALLNLQKRVKSHPHQFTQVSSQKVRESSLKN